MCIIGMKSFYFYVFVARLPSVFATFMYGSMSDATGRKPVLLLALAGAFIHHLIIAVTVTFGV